MSASKMKLWTRVIGAMGVALAGCSTYESSYQAEMPWPTQADLRRVPSQCDIFGNVIDMPSKNICTNIDAATADKKWLVNEKSAYIKGSGSGGGPGTCVLEYDINWPTGAAIVELSLLSNMMNLAPPLIGKVHLSDGNSVDTIFAIDSKGSKMHQRLLRRVEFQGRRLSIEASKPTLDSLGNIEWTVSGLCLTTFY